jgi:hypothetical protein
MKENLLKDLFREISGKLSKKDSMWPYFENKDYVPIKIDKANFHPLCEEEKINVVFIDGGNIEIAGNNNFSLQLMRIYYTIYENNRRIDSKTSTYFVFVDSVKESSSIIYDAKVYQNNQCVETFKYNLSENNIRAKPESIVCSVRRIFEIRTAGLLSNSKTIAVMDGNLAVKNTLEYAEMEKVKSTLIAGISKTSSVMTDAGANLVGYINNISPPDTTWFYHPICKNNNRMHRAEIIIAKLHKKSEFAFMIDIKEKENINQIIYNLSLNSKDPSFLGYPYGLIEADRFARCQEQEKQFLSARFLQSCDNPQKIRKILNTNKAHSILDSIN